MVSSTLSACPICGKSESLKRCGSCKRVRYRSREHQLQHWKVHRAECTHTFKQQQSQETNIVVVVEIKSGQGDGLVNPMMNHLFDSIAQAREYIRERLGYTEVEKMEELTEMPFLTDFMRFSYAVLYVDPHCNAFPPLVDEILRHEPVNEILQRLSLGSVPRGKYRCYGPKGVSELNAMAIYFGCTIDDGLSRFLNARGDAFFIGTTAKKRPVTSNILWGAANFLCDAMRYYPDIEKGRREEIFWKWGRQYLREEWSRLQEIKE